MPSLLMWASAILAMIFLFGGVPASACGPGKFFGSRRMQRKLTPLVYKEHIPNTEEFSLAAAEPPEGKLTRNDAKFKELVPNYSKDIIFKDEEGTGSDRLMSNRCKEKLDTLAISVMNMYPGVKLRVTEAWDDEGYHAPQSLHNEGRAVDITTSDRDRSKYGMLARLAVEAGFDFVYYESRGHIHCSVKPESAEARSGGCFSSNSLVQTETGRKRMSELHLGDRVLVITPEGQLDYSEVILFLDRDENNTRTYLSIETESGAKITLTPVHLIFTETNNTTTGEWGSYTTYAKNVQIGHYVYVVSHSASPEIGQQLILDKVVNITVATEGGVYAPLTQHGNVVVNDVVASCYAVMSDQKIAHWAFFPMRILHNFKQACRIALQKLHLVQLRTPKTKRNDQDTGIHWYATFLYTLTRTLFPRYLYT